MEKSSETLSNGEFRVFYRRSSVLSLAGMVVFLFLMDLLLAAQAKTKQLILVTNNTKDFERVEGIKIENWIEE